jgi:hypothetical protein
MNDYNLVTRVLFVLVAVLLGGGWLFLYSLVKTLRRISDDVHANLMRMCRLIEDFDAPSKPRCYPPAALGEYFELLDQRYGKDTDKTT